MSNINPYNIDGTYPIAGQDNDSQGFRDNFTNIRNNFSYATSEITDLQNKAITTSALTGGTLTNNMNFSLLQRPQLYSASYGLQGPSTLTGSITLDYLQGTIQKIVTNGSLTLGFINWPTSGQYGSMILWVYISNTSHTVTVPITSPGVTVGLNDIAGSNVVTGVINFDQVGNYLLEFNTTDGGQNIFIRDISRNYSTLRDPNFYWDDSVVQTLLVGFGGGPSNPNITVLNTAIAFEAGRNMVAAQGSYNSVSIGNLTLANLKYATLDTGPMAGYTVTSTRGNLQTGTISPVFSGDLLGYINAITLTGNGSGNAFTQSSRIDFHATGANVLYGYGGNIAFWTSSDGGGSNQNNVTQAMGLENDQSARVFGNLVVSTSTASTTSSYVPVTSGSKGIPGQFAWDSTYWYMCTATNTWKRTPWASSSW